MAEKGVEFARSPPKANRVASRAGPGAGPLSEQRGIEAVEGGIRRSAVVDIEERRVFLAVDDLTFPGGPAVRGSRSSAAGSRSAPACGIEGQRSISWFEVVFPAFVGSVRMKPSGQVLGERREQAGGLRGEGLRAAGAGE